MANPLTAEQITEIAISQKIKNIIVFDDTPETAPYSMHSSISDPVHENAVMIIYGYARVHHFISSVDSRVGRHESIIIPQESSEAEGLAVSGFIFGRVLPRITCGYQILNPQTGQTSQFSHHEILPAEHESGLIIVVDENPIQQINLYFEITAMLETDTEKIKFENIPPLHTVLNQKIEEWYPDKRPVHKLTAFDNPFGPYTNYMVTL